ncbi:hypothetical protein BGX38DRAFT_1276161 [Terfezia claveryi]|nr:hypothetical protein BGX38DRAFT_1276161 [Terfezia claveryi]
MPEFNDGVNEDLSVRWNNYRNIAFILSRGNPHYGLPPPGPPQLLPLLPAPVINPITITHAIQSIVTSLKIPLQGYADVILHTQWKEIPRVMGSFVVIDSATIPKVNATNELFPWRGPDVPPHMSTTLSAIISYCLRILAGVGGRHSHSEVLIALTNFDKDSMDTDLRRHLIDRGTIFVQESSVDRAVELVLCLADTWSPPFEVIVVDLNLLGVAYIKAYSLYACMQCQRGIKPIDILKHMNKHHGIQIDQEWRDNLEQALRLYPGQDPMFIEPLPSGYLLLGTFKYWTAGHATTAPTPAFTLGVGRRFFAVLLELKISGSQPMAPAPGYGAVDPMVGTNWMGFPFRSVPPITFGVECNPPNIVQVDTPEWMISVLDRVAEAFTALWVAAEHSLSTEATNSTLVLLKSYKSGSYAYEDIVPSKLQHSKQPVIGIATSG